MKAQSEFWTRNHSWELLYKATFYLATNQIKILIEKLDWHVLGGVGALDFERFAAAKYELINARKHGGTMVCHLLQDLKVPGSNLEKD